MLECFYKEIKGVDIISIIFFGIGLAMDCFAVSTTKGLSQGRWCKQALLMAFLFGLFQGGMPLIGYYTGTLFATFFSRFAPWIALGLLGFIGGKMVWESLHHDEESNCDAHRTQWTISNLLILAVATSIDALATGVIFIPYPKQLWIGVGIIALTSFVFSIAGYLMGVFVGKLKVNVELIGGLILIAIGLKIFIEGYVCH